MSTNEWYEDKKLTDPGYFKRKRQTRIKQLNANPELLMRNKVSKQRSAAINKRGLSWTLPKDKAVQMLLETEICSLSGRELSLEYNNKNSPSLDRIQNHLGYTSKNVQVTSQQVNIARGEMSVEEFVQMCLDVVKHNGYRVRAK